MLESLARYSKSLGPGIVYAAAAVGVSHLVQATRAGAEYGLSLLWVFLVISLIKFPGFFLASRYATLTSRPIGEAYLKMGGFATAVMVLSILADFFISMAVVALVTAGLVSAVAGLSFDVKTIAVMIMSASALLLYSGRYSRFESLIKILVMIFAVLIVVVALSASVQLPNLTVDMWPEITGSRASLLFIIAVAAWMPTPLSVSFYVSAWTAEKQRNNPLPVSKKIAAADNEFAFGYGLTIFLAFCFTLTGAVFLFAAGEGPATTAVGFSAQLIGLFAGAIGQWGWGIIAAAAIGVMVSTVVSLMDGTCRSLEATAMSILGPRAHYFAALLVLQIVGAAVILYIFSGAFTVFVDIATSTAFVSAPLVVHYNYKAVALHTEHPLSHTMMIWSSLAVVVLVAVLGLYLFTFL